MRHLLVTSNIEAKISRMSLNQNLKPQIAPIVSPDHFLQPVEK